MIKATITSVLGNTSSGLLKPVETPVGTFQIEWVDAICSHALFLDRGMGGILVATMHNGFSLEALVKRVKEGIHEEIKEMLNYIRKCGGTAAAEHFFVDRL